MESVLTPRRVALAALAAAAVSGLALASISKAAQHTVVDPGLVDIDTTLGYQGGAAAGTGIVLTSNGEILTNNHVIRGATKIRVTDIANGHTYSAKVVGYSVANDVAVIQLQGASGLRTAQLSDATKVHVGDPVTAVGNAGGVGGAPSVANGSITGLGRSITASDGEGDSEQLTGLIETDAALQPGDSGGALVDTSGRVVGMLTAASTGFQFMYQSTASDGYAITINHATSLATQIVAGASSSTVHIGGTPLLGVTIQNSDGGFGGFNPYFGDSPATNGAVVASVLSGSPAEHAGLQFGDVITSVDGHAIDSSTTLSSYLLLRQPGKTVTLGWVDQTGSTHRASVTLAVGPPQ
ncbi:MAG: trypsin-like peptidase domain-containing protein [Actinobacteria bacterium]|nr:trypsin-like peptidase domain-containing protein [Actinomycetota bacterium]MBV8396436.1 trypsin-like peptidase domain-containing protein [Actinomycetota bacterium]MBV8597473.1 trypsin-like peptidase domain-containing protein [Actinomycetota bacterium]